MIKNAGTVIEKNSMFIFTRPMSQFKYVFKTIYYV